MTDSSRLDAAKRQEEAQAGGAWYRSPLALVAGCILFVGALALVVIGITGSDETDSQVVATAATSAPISFGGLDVPETDVVTLTGEALPAFTTDEDPALGLRAPEITATSLATGTTISLGPGKARVIGFFAHWCGHCQAELPEVTTWLADNRLPPNTEFVAVSTAVDEGSGNYPPSQWFTEVGFNSPVLVDDAEGSMLGGFGFSGFPAFVAIDASGTVVGRANSNIGSEGLADLFAKFAS